MNTVILEREIKLEFGSVDEARQAVLAAGAHPATRPAPAGRFAARHRRRPVPPQRRCVLRVRIENGKSRLTFKGPVQPSVMKVREELETVVGDGEVLLRVFDELGLHVWFRYQKYREEFSHEDVIVAVDETPGRRVRRDRGQRAAASRTWPPRSAERRRLHRRLVSRVVPEASRGARADTDPTWCSTAAHEPAAGARARRPVWHQTPAAHVRSRQGGGRPSTARRWPAGSSAGSSGQGVRDLVLNLHHLPETITASVGDGSDLDARVRYSWEQPVLGSAGGPRHALPLLLDGAQAVPHRQRRHADRRRSARRCCASHAGVGALVTMALIPNPRPEKYGGVRVSGGRVTGFTRAGAPGDSYHFIGVQIAEARAFADLEDGVPAETVNSLYPRLIAGNPASVAAFTCAASFRDIGTPSDYLDTSAELAALEGDRMASGHRVDVAPSARPSARRCGMMSRSAGTRSSSSASSATARGFPTAHATRAARSFPPAAGRAGRRADRRGLLIKPIDGFR